MALNSLGIGTLFAPDRTTRQMVSEKALRSAGIRVGVS